MNRSVDPLRSFRTGALALAVTAVVSATGSAQGLPFPSPGWPVATPESQGLDSTILQNALTSLPWPINQGPLIVIANGHQVFSIGDVTAPKDLFSCSKVVTALLAARAKQQGSISSLDELVPNTIRGPWGQNYQGDASFRQFITMTSDHNLLPYQPVGGQYAYSNNGVEFYGEHLGQTYFGASPDQMDVAADNALFSIIGRQDPIGFVGQYGGWFGGLQVSARDLARIGYLMLRDGQWNGTQVVDSEIPQGLFEGQIPVTAQRYQSANPNENSQWNQQAVTDLLGPDEWSYGMWRVGDIKADKTWRTAAAEGFRGKRLILFPKGSLPNSQLEVVLVNLPNPNNEGPASSVYRDAIVSAVQTLPDHPQQDLDCVIATFDDGEFGRLEPRFGEVMVQDGDLVMTGSSRMLLPDTTMQDGHALIVLPSGLPTPDTWAGVVFRASDPSHGAFTTGATQTTVRLVHKANGNRELEVLRSIAGAVQTYFLPIPGWNQNLRTEVFISFVGDTLGVSINGGKMFGTGLVGDLNPGTDGYLSLQTGGGSGNDAIDISLFAARDDTASGAQISVDSQGRQTIAFLAPNLLFAFDPTFTISFGNLVGGIAELGQLAPFLYPQLQAFSVDHLVLSQDLSYPAFLARDTSVVLTYGGASDGEYVR